MLQMEIYKLQPAAERECDQDVATSQGLSLYVPPHASPMAVSPSVLLDDYEQQLRDGRVFDLEKYVEQHCITVREAPVLCLMGNAGAGKSLFGRHLERHMWTARCTRLPLFISLPIMFAKRGRLTSPFDVVEAFLVEHRNVPASSCALLRDQEWMIILDGFDEVAYTSHEPFSTHCGLHKWPQANIIFSCRSEQLRRPAEALFPLGGRRVNTLYLVPFAPSQIRAYTAKFVLSCPFKWSEAQYAHHLKAMEGVQQLIREPFVLNLVLQSLPALVQQRGAEGRWLRRSVVYEQFVKNWFEREKTKFIEAEDDIKVLFRWFSWNLASTMWMEGIQVALGDIAEGYNAFQDLFSGGERNRKGLKGSPLKRVDNNKNYMFIHKTFQEFFASEMLLVELEKGIGCVDVDAKGSAKWKKPVTLDQVQVSMWSQYTINKRQLAYPADASMIRFMSDRVAYGANASLEQALKNLVLASRDHPELQVAAANALTVLVAANVSMCGQDLRGIRVPGAYLAGGLFERTQFQGSDLRKVCFANCELNYANLTNCNLDEVEMGYKILKGHQDTVRYVRGVVWMSGSM
jgi:hypothetical protein